MSSSGTPSNYNSSKAKVGVNETVDSYMFRFVRQSSLTSTLCYIKGGAVHSLNYSSKIGVNETLDSVMVRRRQWWYQSWVKVDSAPFSHELHVCILHTFIRCRVAQFCQKLSFKKLPGSRARPHVHRNFDFGHMVSK